MNPFEPAISPFFGLAFILLLPLFLFRTAYFTHMFQLNGYKVPLHLKWLKQHRQAFFTLHLPGGPVKKKLVATQRVRRLWVCFTLLNGIILTLSGLFLGHYAIIVLIVLFLACPYSILVANWINKPIEAAVNRHYLNDAKRILAEHRNLLVIGITGSFGKTSTKYFLTSLLQSRFETLMTPENYNTTMGVVKTIRESLRATHQIFVCEMGARQQGDIKEICDLVNPKLGVVTAIGEQHLESFLSLENIVKTKFELAQAASKVFVNLDSDPISENLGDWDIVSYGTKADKRPDFLACDQKLLPTGTSFNIIYQGKKYPFSTRLIGSHNILNITAAVAVAHTLGIPINELTESVKRLVGVPHRLQLIPQGNVTLIDDAYNSNPQGARAALDVLSSFDGKKILITPGMVELGEREYDENFGLGVYAATRCDIAFVIGKEHGLPIANGLKSAGFADENIYIKDSFKEAIAAAYGLCQNQRSAILIENDLPDNYTN